MMGHRVYRYSFGPLRWGRRDRNIYMEAANYPKTLTDFWPNIIWVRGTFDQNMHPAYYYLCLLMELSYLWWWDPVNHIQLPTLMVLILQWFLLCSNG